MSGFISCLASLLSIAVGLLVGLVVLFSLNAPYALVGFNRILTTGVASLEKLAKALHLKRVCLILAPRDSTRWARSAPSPPAFSCSYHGILR